MNKKEKIQVRQFKDNSSNWWVDNAHYFLNEKDEICWAAGEMDKTELRTVLEQYIKRNKKKFVPRQESTVLKTYDEVINFGRHISKTVDMVFIQEPTYLKWMLDSYDFSGKEKLKQQITEILK